MVQARIFVSSILASALMAAPVMAQPAAGRPAATANGQVEQLAREANVAYKAKDYSRAVALYLQAYKLQPAAAVLYNVAIIYDKKLNEPELAATFYRRYIGSPDADTTAVVRATSRLGELKAAQAKRQAAAAPQPVVVAPIETPKGESSGQGTLGWTLAGIGAAALIGGGVMGFKAAGTHDDFAASTNLDQKLALREDGQSEALTADVLMGVGGALLITGAVLALTAPQTESTAWRLMPTADGAGASVWIGGSL
jgi:tetratricopeptide (TPR) repeat protein